MSDCACPQCHLTLPASAHAGPAVQGLKDPEAKRKAIGSGFIDVFTEFASSLQKAGGTKPRFLVQVRSLNPAP